MTQALTHGNLRWPLNRQSWRGCSGTPQPSGAVSQLSYSPRRWRVIHRDGNGSAERNRVWGDMQDYAGNHPFGPGNDALTYRGAEG